MTYMAQTSEEKEYQCKDWAKCAQEKDVIAARKLLNDNIIPNREDLQLAFDNFVDDIKGKTLLKDICRKIENHLMETNESIENVKGCYKHDDPGKKIIFVTQTTSEKSKIDCQYILHVIGQHIEQVNEKMEIKKMTRYPFKDRFNEANECLRIKSPVLMKSHSNLTGTSLSPDHETCIVLYVEAKGYVPVGEDNLPSSLEYKDTIFKTVVRESQCAIATCGGPSDKHENLKIGCRIESSKEPNGGTLGGFIDYPGHGLCAITSSHVLFSDEDIEQICKGQLDVESIITTPCFQPKRPDKFGEVCDVRFFERDQKEVDMEGDMEIAFVKVDKSRKPITPSFPDISADDGELSFKDDSLPQPLRYDPRSVLQELNQIKIGGQVVKYGFKTKLTSGIFNCSGSSCRVEIKRKGKRKITLILNDQIEILDQCKEFSDFGDSGAMVFLMNRHKKLMAMGILCCRKNDIKKTYVTPICNILKEIQSPRPYQLAELPQE